MVDIIITIRLTCMFSFLKFIKILIVCSSSSSGYSVWRLVLNSPYHLSTSGVQRGYAQRMQWPRASICEGASNQWVLSRIECLCYLQYLICFLKNLITALVETFTCIYSSFPFHRANHILCPCSFRFRYHAFAVKDNYRWQAARSWARASLDTV